MALQSYNQYVERPAVTPGLAASVGALIQRRREEEGYNERFETQNQRQDDQIAERYRRIDEAAKAAKDKEMINKYLTVKQKKILDIRNIEDETEKRKQILRHAQDAVANGEDPSMYEQLYATENIDELDFALAQIATRIDTHLGTKPDLMTVSQGQSVIDANTGKPVFSNEADDWEVVYDADGNPLAQRDPATGELKKHPNADDTLSLAEFDQKMKLYEAQAEVNAAAQDNSAMGQLARQTAALQVEKIQNEIAEAEENRKLDAEERANESVEDSQTREVKRAEAESAIDLVNGLLLNDNYKFAFGKANNAVPELLRRQETIDAQAQLGRVNSLLSLESRKKLAKQGTISDSESAILEKSASLLANPYISEQVAQTELMRVLVLFQDAAARQSPKGKSGTTPKAQSIKLAPLTPAEQQELNDLEAKYGN